ncbi:hypothetical protein [Arthrobacter mobilis]|uniref:DUF4352 domain-containing protein n=1 Tax=Arthrobacter mobilis TaxID=2724944 RepID=A0A7X6K5S1_9MICC|nr:hypothetical protein [Arthrobacter mobilis]NKX54185.1 hypothetical protein [Arthrobacter mobilis]
MAEDNTGDTTGGGKPASWWTTMPGILTAAAALITAVTGLVVGLAQAGLLGRPGPEPGPAASSPAAPGPAETPAGTSGRDGASGPDKPAGSGGWEATVPTGEPIRSGTVEYVVTGAQVRPDADGYLAVAFTIKCINHDRYDLNFWDSTFRLQIGGDSIAPVSGLNELVAGDSTKTGEVAFRVPDSTREAVLRIKFLEGERSVPVALSPR